MTNRKSWTKEEIDILIKSYQDSLSINDICKLLNRTSQSICSKARRLGLTQLYIKPNSSKYTAIYQNYNWCYQHYIIEGMNYQEMANLANCSKRVIEKWCSEKHQLNRLTRINEKQLTEEQFQIIMMGTLGDGHIDKRPTQHMYIESHAEDEKEYIFWKYDKLKNLCNNEPKYYKGKPRSFGTDKIYETQNYYRMSTHLLSCLTEIFNMTKQQKIDKMTDFGLCLYLLDDGYRSSSQWSLCVAMLTEEDKQFFVEKCKKLNYNCHILKDNRYISFDSVSSRQIDKKMIEIFGDIDIIKKKILNNNLAKDPNYLYVNVNGNNIGISAYIRHNYYQREKRLKIIQEYMNKHKLKVIDEQKFREIMND
jgi:hypothetical protein